ncbi:MAG: hypothetical protein DRZ79_01035 [Candidatus Cloacimonadota bacterium]|nr:MAG: hypothetical protein DRZ79_01035 [Candidatus Cloacimonadota bacterium]
MAKRKKDDKSSWFYSPKVHLLLYELLLIATPFLLLQNYLQAAIGIFSEKKVEIFGISIPLTVLIAIIFLSGIIILLRKKIKPKHLFIWLIVIILIRIGQNSTDYYFHHKFYELQHNWHYLAYGIFAYVMYRNLKHKNVPIEKKILITFVTALGLSTFDEFIQVYISNRIFDICDIGKDAWGTVNGMIIVYFVIAADEMKNFKWKWNHPHLRDYLKNPKTLLSMEIIFTFILLNISSLLTDKTYLFYSVLFSISAFLIVFFIIHFFRFKIARIAIILFLGAAIIIQGFFFFKYRKENIVYNKYGLTVYKGIPIPFFDIMIYQNGSFRLVDKKHSFNKRDISTISHYADDILLIGSGTFGKGGYGFPEKKEVQFIYNEVKKKPLQVIILKTPEACRVYNRLKAKGYKVLFIIHNTC